MITPSGGDQVYFKFNSSAAARTTSTRKARPTSASTSGTTLPNGGREALVTVGLSFEDEDEYSYSQTAKVKVAP